MGNVSRQIGWSNESNLLYQILNQLIRLTKVVFSSAPKTTYTFPTTGVSTFTVTAITGKTVITASRSGLIKIITTGVAPTLDYLQIVGDVVTLPTGDVISTDEWFSFTYTG